MTACVVCGGSSGEPLYRVNGFDVVRCTCGLARTELPPGFDPATIYTEAYFQGGHHDGYADYESSADDLRREFRRTVDALRRRTSSGRLIEVGCAYGYFLDEAAAYFEVTGVEISDAAREQAAARGHAVYRELDDDAIARGPFDAAVLLDVVEHLVDPGEVFARLHAAMRPGASLMLTTGDWGSLLARAMGKRWRLMTPPQHLWFFSPQTIRALLDRHGFVVRDVAHPWKLAPVSLIAYQAARYVGGQRLVQRVPLPGFIPVNLFDAMRVIAERR